MKAGGILPALSARMSKKFSSRRLAHQTSEGPDTVILVPGWNDSGPGHWQSLWEGLLPRAMRVRQTNWQIPRLDEWMVSLETAIRAADSPVVLVGHSLGCILLAHYFARVRSLRNRIRGALLVAPADVESEERSPPVLRDFAPIPKNAFCVPTIVVGSRNDPYMSIERAHHFALHWNAEFVDLGFSGHINADSGLGAFPDGLSLLCAFSSQGPVAYARASSSWASSKAQLTA